MKTEIKKNSNLKTFVIRKKVKMDSKTFINKFIEPFEGNNIVKENISENMNEYLVNLK